MYDSMDSPLAGPPVDLKSLFKISPSPVTYYDPHRYFAGCVQLRKLMKMLPSRNAVASISTIMQGHQTGLAQSYLWGK
jgi:hypothetical protein